MDADRDLQRHIGAVGPLAEPGTLQADLILFGLGRKFGSQP